jgi:hypothetical protein
MKPYLSKAAKTLRDQINETWLDRDKRSDGWISDSKHALRKSDHNPRPDTAEVCAIDIDAGLSDEQGISHALADQLRLTAKKDKRISYIIHAGKICSAKSLWRWVKYRGLNPHNKHIHISFKENQNGKPFNIPLLGGTNEVIKKA